MSFNRAEPEAMSEIADVFLRSVAAREGSAEASVAHRISGTTCYWRGDYVGARHHLETAVATYDAGRDAASTLRFGQNIGVSALCYLAIMLRAFGDIRRAGDLFAQALAHASESGHPPTLAFALGVQCLSDSVHLISIQTLPRAKALVSLAREHSLPYWLTIGLMTCGWARWHTGERQAGEADMRCAEAKRREQGLNQQAPTFGHMIADVEARSGRFESALRVLNDLLIDNRRTQQLFLDAELHRQRGDILLQCSPPDPNAAEAAFVEAITVSRAQRTRSFELRAALDLARLYCATGREHDARDILAPTLVGFSETPELPEIGEAQRLLADIGESP